MCWFEDYYKYCISQHHFIYLIKCNFTSKSLFVTLKLGMLLTSTSQNSSYLSLPQSDRGRLIAVVGYVSTYSTPEHLRHLWVRNYLFFFLYSQFPKFKLHFRDGSDFRNEILHRYEKNVCGVDNLGQSRIIHYSTTIRPILSNLNEIALLVAWRKVHLHLTS